MDGNNSLSAKHLFSRRLTSPRWLRQPAMPDAESSAAMPYWCPLRGRFNKLKPPVHFRKVLPDVLLAGKVSLRGAVVESG